MESGMSLQMIVLVKSCTLTGQIRFPLYYLGKGPPFIMIKTIKTMVQIQFTAICNGVLCYMLSPRTSNTKVDVRNHMTHCLEGQIIFLKTGPLFTGSIINWVLLYVIIELLIDNHAILIDYIL